MQNPQCDPCPPGSGRNRGQRIRPLFRLPLLTSYVYVTQFMLVFLLGRVPQLVNSYHLNLNANENTLALQEDNEFSDTSSSPLKSLESKLDSILDTESHEKKLLESLLWEKEQNDRHEQKPPPTPTPKRESMSMESIVQSLVDNSRRMESMVGMLTDFRTVLTQTVSGQEKQMGYKTEVIALREEVGYMREEIQRLKSQQASFADSDRTGKGKNARQNNQKTINWLKDSVKELRHEIAEVSSSLNVTGLLHLQQQLRLQERSASRDVQALQRRIEGLQLNSDQVNEQLLEVQRDLADVRTWQVKMGRRLMKNYQNLKPNQNSIEIETETATETGASRILKELEEINVPESESGIHKKNNNKNGKGNESERGRPKTRARHSKKRHTTRGRGLKLELELHRVEKLMLEMAREQNSLAKKVERLETNTETEPEINEGAVWKKVVETGNGDNDNDDGLVTITTYSDVDTESNNINDNENDKKRKKRSLLEAHRRRIRRDEVYENIDGQRIGSITVIQNRISALETSLSEHANKFDLMDNKVTGLEELHTTTKSLFTSLETLENKYDLKISELQTNMAQVEAGVSGVQVATDELKEQQGQQSQGVQACKRESHVLSESLRTTDLRVAALQSQMLSLELKQCQDSNADSIRRLKEQNAAFGN